MRWHRLPCLSGNIDFHRRSAIVCQPLPLSPARFRLPQCAFAASSIASYSACCHSAPADRSSNQRHHIHAALITIIHRRFASIISPAIQADCTAAVSPVFYSSPINAHSRFQSNSHRTSRFSISLVRLPYPFTLSIAFDLLLPGPQQRRITFEPPSASINGFAGWPFCRIAGQPGRAICPGWICRAAGPAGAGPGPAGLSGPGLDTGVAGPPPGGPPDRVGPAAARPPGPPGCWLLPFIAVIAAAAAVCPGRICRAGWIARRRIGPIAICRIISRYLLVGPILLADLPGRRWLIAGICRVCWLPPGIAFRLCICPVLPGLPGLCPPALLPFRLCARLAITGTGVTRRHYRRITGVGPGPGTGTGPGRDLGTGSGRDSWANIGAGSGGASRVTASIAQAGYGVRGSGIRAGQV